MNNCNAVTVAACRSLPQTFRLSVDYPPTVMEQPVNQIKMSQNPLLRQVFQIV